jgi:hypothetical protein
MSKNTEKKAAELALGRIFGMMQRPNKTSDEAEFYRCRKIIMDAFPGEFDDTEHSFARDYKFLVNSGQAG